MAQYQDLEFFRKGTPSYELIFTKDGAPINITDWTIYLTVKENMVDTDANAKIKRDITTHTDAVNGKSLITLTSTETDLIGNYYYSFDFKDDEGNEGVLYHGRMKISDTVRDERT